MKKKVTVTDFQDRAAELDCDPLKFAADYINGKVALERHPFLTEIEVFIADLVVSLESGSYKPRQLQVFLEAARAALDETRVNNALAVKVSLELIKYLYPQRRSVEHVISPGDTPIDTMSDEYLQELLRNTSMRIADGKPRGKKKKLN